MVDTDRDWKHFALLLIDVQKDFWTERLQSSFPDFHANITRLLALCRNEGVEVVHLRGSFKPDRSDWMVRHRLHGTTPCVEGTEGIETLSFAAEEPGEVVFAKQTFDGFHNPNLLLYLRKKEKRFLLTAGLVTSVCVFLTTASAAQLGFLTTVVEDCCADKPPKHEQILERHPFIFGRTTTHAICDNYAQWSGLLRKLESE
jgi:ureidoacrylate peracid hydrolase